MRDQRLAVRSIPAVKFQASNPLPQESGVDLDTGLGLELRISHLCQYLRSHKRAANTCGAQPYLPIEI